MRNKLIFALLRFYINNASSPSPKKLKKKNKQKKLSIIRTSFNKTADTDFSFYNIA